MRKRLIVRIWIMGGILTSVVLLLVVRLYFLQIVYAQAYALEAESQYVNTSNGIYDRGNIFMSQINGSKIASATVRARFVLAIDTRFMGSTEAAHLAIYSKLEEIVKKIDKQDFLRRANKENDPYEVIAKGLTKAIAEEVEALDIDGVILTQERERYYPGGSMAASVLGFVGFDANNARVGRYGLERYYDYVLQRDSSNLYVNFFAELFTNIKEAATGEGMNEGDIVLTIDPDVQVFVEEELAKAKKKWHSKMTAAIVMNPQNGEILAMATTPTFDLNNFNKARGVRFDNPLVSGVYEMGSIIKVLTMAIGLDTKAIKKTTTYNDTGSLTLNRATIHNYDHRARGVVPMQEILSQSLNVGTAFIANKVGHKQMREYFIDRLLLGEETGIDLPAEGVGNVTNLASEREIEFATASFGQGVAFTPIATIRAIASLTNGGYMVQPHMVKRIEYNTGLNKVFDYSDQKEKVFESKTVETVSQMLTKVVDEVLAKGKYKNEHYSMAVKTGTAQLVKNGKYRKDAYLHTYVGYGPSYHGEFIILLMNLEPVGAKYASQTLTEPFMNIAHFLINHLDIAPDR